MSGAPRLRVMLPTLGSSGDVHPFIALGLELKRRGHHVTVLTNPLFRSLVESQGLAFLPVGSEAEARAAIRNPKIWDGPQGFRIIARTIAPAMEQVYRLIERHADSSTVVGYSTLAFGGRLAQEKLAVPAASIHLQPSVLRSVHEQGMLGNMRLSAAQPRWLKRAVFGLVDWLLLDRSLAPTLNELRRSLGLAPVRSIMGKWMHSPQLVLGFFPDWFAAPQPDWPANFHAVGFPLWDRAPPVDFESAEAFLADGPPPLVFTPGSAGSTMQRFFVESVVATLAVGERAMLVTNFPEQLPRNLPPTIKAFEYLPFSRILPRAAVLVYHGGIGTLSQALHSGVPQLCVPHAYDQFDNGWRIARLGVGVSVPIERYTAARVAPTIRQLIDNEGVRSRRLALRGQLDGERAMQHAADLIEGLRAPARAAH